ncbi:MAG: pyridoxine 5'-phosphate synthase [Chloroflexota bacterium]
MTKLSVNINKIATLRNARGGNIPNVLKVALDCESFGAQGITVHPRPDERHIRYQDVYDLKPVIKTEFNIEGNPERKFMDLVTDVKPAQVTLVPDAQDALTSNHGWDTLTYKNYLTDIISELHKHGIRTSIFVDPVPQMVELAAHTGTDRIELYTESYASGYHSNRQIAIAPFMEAAKAAMKAGLGINAGHDLNLDNLRFFASQIDGLLEVSIGHALVADALYYGLNKTIQLYLSELSTPFDVK